MDYYKLYNKIIKLGYKNKPTDGYYERHHIMPKSLGGSDSEDNLVYLTGRQHFLCHWILTKMHPDSREMAAAFWLFCNKKNNEKVISSRVYENARIAHAERHGPYISELMLNSPHRYRGKKLSKDHVEKVRKSVIEREAHKSLAPFHNKIKCDVCGKEGSKSNMIRWHFDNCGKPRVWPKDHKCEQCGVTVTKQHYFQFHGKNCKLARANDSS